MFGLNIISAYRNYRRNRKFRAMRREVLKHYKKSVRNVHNYIEELYSYYCNGMSREAYEYFRAEAAADKYQLMKQFEEDMRYITKLEMDGQVCG